MHFSWNFEKEIYSQRSRSRNTCSCRIKKKKEKKSSLLLSISRGLSSKGRTSTTTEQVHIIKKDSRFKSFFQFKLVIKKSVPSMLNGFWSPSMVSGCKAQRMFPLSIGLWARPNPITMVLKVFRCEDQSNLNGLGPLSELCPWTVATGPESIRPI